MSDHEWRQVKVTFRKAVSDGNYGTESAEVALEDWLPVGVSGMGYDAAVATLLNEARQHVHAELLRSESPRVREAIERIRTYSGHGVAGEDDDGQE